MFDDKSLWRSGWMIEGKPEVLVRILCNDRVGLTSVFGLKTEIDHSNSVQEIPFYVADDGMIPGGGQLVKRR